MVYALLWALIERIANWYLDREVEAARQRKQQMYLRLVPEVDTSEPIEISGDELAMRRRFASIVSTEWSRA